MIGLVSGLRFVLDKVAGAVDAELDDEAVLRERLLRAQLDLEEGRLTEAEFATLEAQLFERLREVRAARGGEQLGAGSWRVEGIEADAGSAPAKRRR
ncbi:MAG TPA: gas vesicle protein GvpG [Myxococcales bacterium]|nr:gas vesicle protein GvpG [Myxococcales bacterium]